MNLHGPGEIQKGFDHAIEAANFLHQDLHLWLHLFSVFAQSRLQHFQLQHHGVQRVLDFVRDARHQSPDGGKFGGGVNLVLKFRTRARVAQGDEATHALVAFAHELRVHGEAGARLAGQFEGFPKQRLAGLKSLA